jgi:hypothetical protein
MEATGPAVALPRSLLTCDVGLDGYLRPRREWYVVPTGGSSQPAEGSASLALPWPRAAGPDTSGRDGCNLGICGSA